jgi:two-component system chemotaxis sensor kinase CheA
MTPTTPTDAAGPDPRRQVLDRLLAAMEGLSREDGAALAELEGEIFLSIGAPGLTEADRTSLAEAATLLDSVASGRSDDPAAELARARVCLGGAETTGGKAAGTRAAESAARARPKEPSTAGAVMADDMLADFDREFGISEPALFSPDADPELLQDFLVEAGEDLDRAEEALMELEADPEAREALDTVFRAFHTIKGTSAFLGLETISELTHHAESLLDRVRGGELAFSRRVADLCLRSVDLVRLLLEQARDDGEGGAPEGLSELVRDLEEACAWDPGEEEGPASGIRASAAGDEGGEDGGRRQGTRSALGKGAGTQEASVRVRTDRLDRLIDTVGELVIAQSILTQEGSITARENEGLARKISHTGKIVRELQDLSMSMRMVPLRGTFRKATRLVRDLAARSGKRVRFVAEGEDTEIDRSMVDVLGDPLVHMIRNSMDHGLETPDERAASGKPPEGVVRLRAYHEGGNVVVELSDDGRGLNRERILGRARERGIVEPGRTLSEQEIYQLIFAPGFSTAETVTDLSGRGVGMDVVRRNIESIRGRIEVRSEEGQGTTVSMILPLTLAITDGMLVRVGQERFLVPTLAIEVTFRPGRDAVSTVTGKGEMVVSRGELLPLLRLSRVLKVPGAVEDPTQGIAVVISEGGARYSLLVDELLGQQQVVAKSLGAGIGRVEGISGGAILGDGTVGLLLDPVGIQKAARGTITGDDGRGGRDRGEAAA